MLQMPSKQQCAGLAAIVRHRHPAEKRTKSQTPEKSTAHPSVERRRVEPEDDRTQVLSAGVQDRRRTDTGDEADPEISDTYRQRLRLSQRRSQKVQNFLEEVY